MGITVSYLKSMYACIRLVTIYKCFGGCEVVKKCYDTNCTDEACQSTVYTDFVHNGISSCYGELGLMLDFRPTWALTMTMPKGRQQCADEEPRLGLPWLKHLVYFVSAV